MRCVFAAVVDFLEALLISFKEEIVMPNYYCKYCGQRFSSLAMLETNHCIRHPEGPQNHHELYEKGEQTHYVCKYCGQKYFSIADMTANRCPHHPKGRGQGRHAPEE